MKKIKGIISVMICTALLAGCGRAPEPPAVTTVTSEALAVTTSVTTKAPVSAAAALDGEDEPAGTAVKEVKPLVISVDGLDADYSPFVNETDFDKLINKACFTRLLGRTRSGNTVLNGVTGVSEMFGGRKYDYEGIADTAVTHDEENGTTTYAFSLRTDVRFADGEVLDADDVIFSLYAGLCIGQDRALRDADIVGARNYIYNSSIAEELTDEQIKEALASEDMLPIIREKLIIPVLNEQYKSVEALYSDNSHDIYTATYPDPLKLFVFFCSADKSYEVPEGADKDKVISDVAAGYGSDYRRLAALTEGDGSAFDNDVLSIAIAYLTSKRRAEDNGAADPVKNISGIVKTGKFSLTVTVRGGGKRLEDALCELPIAPLHYYGNDTQYDYGKNRFGFVKGKAAELLSGHAGEPMGAGAYTFAGAETDRMLLTANESFWNGKPQTANINVISGSDPIALIAEGVADIGTELCYSGFIEKRDEANRSLEKVITVNVNGAGYGYAAFDVNVVNVGGEQFSVQSCALRKALASAIRYFRDSSVAEYFLEYALPAELPCLGNIMTDTSAEDFTAPYTVDAEGKPIFTAEMTDKEKRDALKAACLGFLEKAGYTVEDGKVTAAPEGGRLVFNAEYSAGGTESHPAKYAFEQAAKLLGEIGITLNVTDMPDAGLYYDDITSGNAALGALSYSGTLRGKFASPLSDALAGELDDLITAAEDAAAEDAQAAYAALYDKMIYEYAAEIPLYERAVGMLYSALRLDKASFTHDMTEWYGQADELHKIKMK